MKNDVLPPETSVSALSKSRSDVLPPSGMTNRDAVTPEINIFAPSKARSDVFPPPFVIISRYVSPFGGMTLASDGDALTGLWFDGQKHFPEFSPETCRELLLERVQEIPLPVFEQTKNWLNVYFSGTAPDFTPPLRPRGTPFQSAVWELLRAVPYGRTVTYGELASRTAQRLGQARMSARAVGSAVGRNPLALLIPCHRVIGAGGKLTGYAAGLETKARLLSLERAAHTSEIIK